jgi:hypothetical protein
MEGLMAEGMIERLSGLLRAHAAREKKLASDAGEKAAAHVAKERKAADVAAAKARADFEKMREFLAVRDRVIAPVATAIAKHLVASGHRARTETTDCAPQTENAAAVPGRLVFAFGLEAVQGTSSLTFTGFPDRVVVHEDFRSSARRTTSFYSSREVPVAEIKQKVVEEMFLNFVSKVLGQDQP